MISIFWLSFLVYTILLFFVITDAFLTFVRTRVPFVPTPEKDLSELVLGLGLKEGDRVLDIGSGNGRVVFIFDRLTPAKATGIEAGLWMHLYAKIKKFFNKSEAEFIWGNFFEKSWKNYTIVYCYLYPQLMKKVSLKVKDELGLGGRVISRDFQIPDLGEPKLVRGSGKHVFYVYEILR